MGCKMCSLLKKNKDEISSPISHIENQRNLDQHSVILESEQDNQSSSDLRNEVILELEQDNQSSGGTSIICNYPEEKFPDLEEEEEEEEEDFKLCKHGHGVEKHNEANEELKEQGIEEEGDERREETAADEDENKLVDMSINTLKLLGKVNKKPIVILIDTGSTHSFLNPKIVQNMGLKCAQISPVHVAVANGDELTCDLVCPKFKWTVQGEPFEKDIMLLKMSGIMGDMVLGMDWVDEFAPVQLDTKPLSISFHKGNRWITLFGMK